jgi:hypothetical protein
MASIPPPPDQPTQPIAPSGEQAPPGPSSRTTIVAILVSVAVIAVIGTVVALASSGDDGGASPSASASAAVAAPADLTARASASRVSISWTLGGGTPPVRYVVTKDGTIATTLDASATEWVDDHVLPESHYSYAVQAVGPDESNATARVVAETKTAPLGTAPLRGVFNVHVHATSHYGFSNFGSENGNLGWRLTPTCSGGPCDTKLADIHQKDFRLTLDRNGTSYHGNVTIHGVVRCRGTAVASSITVTVHVTDAGVFHHRWVATRIEGTMSQSESAQLGCVASGAAFDLRGKVVG